MSITAQKLSEARRVLDEYMKSRVLREFLQGDYTSIGVVTGILPLTKNYEIYAGSADAIGSYASRARIPRSSGDRRIV